MSNNLKALFLLTLLAFDGECSNLAVTGTSNNVLSAILVNAVILGTAVHPEKFRQAGEKVRNRRTLAASSGNLDLAAGSSEIQEAAEAHPKGAAKYSVRRIKGSSKDGEESVVVETPAEAAAPTLDGEESVVVETPAEAKGFEGDMKDFPTLGAEPAAKAQPFEGDMKDFPTLGGKPAAKAPPAAKAWGKKAPTAPEEAPAAAAAADALAAEGSEAQTAADATVAAPAADAPAPVVAQKNAPAADAPAVETEPAAGATETAKDPDVHTVGRATDAILEREAAAQALKKAAAEEGVPAETEAAAAAAEEAPAEEGVVVAAEPKDVPKSVAIRAMPLVALLATVAIAV